MPKIVETKALKETEKVKVTIICSLVNSGGLGNLMRSQVLRDQFKKFVHCEIVVMTDLNPTLVRSSIIVRNVNVTRKLELSSVEIKDTDIFVVDVGELDFGEQLREMRRKLPLAKIVTLDYFKNYDGFDLRIDLFDQKNGSFTGMQSNHLVGLQYALMSEKLMEMKGNRALKPRILFRASGGLSGNLRLLRLEILTVLKRFELEFVELNQTNLVEINREIMSENEYLHLLATSSLFIGSGVTTLLQSAFLGVPTIFIPSTQKEKNFIKSLNAESSKVAVWSRDVMGDLIKNASLSHHELFSGFKPRIDIDLLGPQRVVNAILSRCQI